ncbi:MAG: adenosylhomocysteinase [Dehalococcoidia bacterium]|nr:adenosylhomocysteinase [Dehalococcoidia bacterium]
MAVKNGDVKDVKLANLGKEHVQWAEMEMPVLRQIRKRFLREKPLKGLKISACLHVTSETANLALTLRDGGADLTLCASNPLSTQDDVAAYLTGAEKIPTFAIKGEDQKTYYSHINSALDAKPNLTMDDGADLVATIHTKQKVLLKDIMAGTEETTTGVIRLRSMEAAKKLMYPIVAVNEAMTKHFFDNRYGTGQSTIDGITRATNILWAGKNVVVAGYGWCGRGVASRARGLGGQVIVTEVDPIRALEAVMDGYRVMAMPEAAKIGDFFITVTGDINVIDIDDFLSMKDGAVVANSGHFNVEINIKALEDLAKEKRHARPFVDEYTLSSGRRIYLLAEGRLVNLSAAEGHPASVMDMSFANQALCAEYVYKNYKKLEKKVYVVPENIDKEVGRLKLQAMGVKIDVLTKEQEKYLSGWAEGTS